MTDNKTREQIQQEVEAEAKRVRRTQMTRRALVWGGAFVFLAALVWGLAYLASAPSATNQSNLSDAVTAADWQKGDAQAKLTLVEYSDFQCPYCKIYQSYIKDVLNKYGKDILLVYRNYPLIQAHEHAQIAAQAAGAAGLQNKFWEMHDMLFDKQGEWEHAPNAEDLFVSYAATLGLDVNKFKADFASPAVLDKIKSDVASGDKSYVQATPSFFLNGKQLNLSTYADLEQAVSAALK